MDIACTGKFLDRVGDTSQTKQTLLDSLRAHVHNSAIMWDDFGEYFCEVDNAGGETKVKLCSRSLNKEFIIDSETLGHDRGPFRIIHNWSTKGAFLASPHDSWSCAHFFPGFSRRLRRMASADRGLVGVPTQGASSTLISATPSAGSVAASPSAPQRVADATPDPPGRAQASQVELPAAAMIEEPLPEVS